MQPEVPAGTIGVKIGDMTASEDDIIILVCLSDVILIDVIFSLDAAPHLANFNPHCHGSFYTLWP